MCFSKTILNYKNVSLSDSKFLPQKDENLFHISEAFNAGGRLLVGPGAGINFSCDRKTERDDDDDGNDGNDDGDDNDGNDDHHHTVKLPPRSK